MKKKIGVLGSGIVGKVLASGLLKHGYPTMIASSDTTKLGDWHNENSSGLTGSFQKTAEFGDILLLAVKGSKAKEVLKAIGSEVLAGKTIIDATNPIAEKQPVNGVIQFFTGPNESLMEELQSFCPDAHFVKAFSCVGNAHMVNPDFGEVQPSMFICGNNEEAKQEASEILVDFGWDVADMGQVEAARAIEPLCMLWCIPGMLGHGWNHAFKLLRK